MKPGQIATEMTELQSLCLRVTSGGTPSRAMPEYFEGGTIPWMKTGEVKQRFVYETEEHITELGLENSSAKLIPANSLVVAMYGDGDTAGNVAINKVPLTTNQACCNFVVDPAKADYRFLYYYLKANYNNLVGLKLGGSQQNLNAATLKRFPVPAVPVGLQRKIAAILSAYDDLIANNQRRIALLEGMAEEIYREWFVRMRFPGWQSVPRVGRLPLGWDLKPLSEAVEVNPTERIDQGDDTPFVSMDRLSTSSMYFRYDEKRRDAAGSKFRNGDSLLPRITPCLENGKRGLVSCLGSNEIGVGSTEFIVLRPKQLGPEHVYFLSIDEGLRKHAEISMTGASGRQRVKEDCLDYFLVAVPPPEVAGRFLDTVGPMCKEVGVLAAQSRILARTRDALLPRLISGKLKVDHLDIRLPPSMRAETEAVA